MQWRKQTKLSREKTEALIETIALPRHLLSHPKARARKRVAEAAKGKRAVWQRCGLQLYGLNPTLSWIASETFWMESDTLKTGVVTFAPYVRYHKDNI